MHARLAGLASAIGLHAALLAALLAYEPTRAVLHAASPVMVDWVLPPQAPKPPEPAREPRQARPVVRQPVLRPPEPPPVVAAPAEAPSPVVAPPPAPPAPVEAPAPDAAPAPFTPPVFDAGYLENPPPVYPSRSRRMGEQGRVILRVLVTPEGAAADIQVRTSSGYERLDTAARDVVRRWKFVPARRGAQAVAAWVLIPISFRLEG